MAKYSFTTKKKKLFFDEMELIEIKAFDMKLVKA